MQQIVADLLATRQTFSFRELDPMEFEGSRLRPLQVCEVLYERNDPAALLNRTPFVGRAAQLKRCPPSSRRHVTARARS